MKYSRLFYRRMSVWMAVSMFMIMVLHAYAQTGPSQEELAAQGQYLNTYLNTINSMQSQANKYLGTIAEGVQGAASRGNNAMRESLLADAKRIIAAVLEELGRIMPPEELKIYHTKIIDMFIYRNLANDALLGNNSEAAKRFYRQSSLAYIQALTELKRTFVSFSAPAGIINDLERKIAQENKMLRQIK